ncbi:hypothetical protein [Pseudomonas chlororaphis]|uniref:hypothetical protein n=1 Tax=Pseudomonas chlororaphis TaxID=587753 RepID=UPI002368DE80|nr:hypothetical protein [Pseudomonas chlororaphis]WDG45667.1 hypothetical protein PUP58_18050 [Pseudomonas chlororaphis]
MEHLPVTERQADLVRRAPQEIEEIKVHALFVFDRLRKLLSETFTQQTWGLSLISQGSGPSAEILTPFGPIRMDLVPFVNDQGVQGRYVIEKQGISETGQSVWRKIWSLRLDVQGRVFQGDEATVFIPSRLRFPGVDNDIALLALSILYAAGKES